MSERSVLMELVRRGRSRQVRQLLFHQASFAASLGLGGAILLLIVGTQILNWYWPVLLFVASLAVAAYRSRDKILSRYQVAQSIDQRLGLHDSLSTAVFFSQPSERTIPPRDVIARQRDAAEELARSVDVQRGLPFFVPRTLYVNAALAAIVCSMFGVRYGINHSLDLRPSLVRIGFEGFLGSREVARAQRGRGQRPFQQDNRDQGIAADLSEAKPDDSVAANAAQDAAAEPSADNVDAPADSSAAKSKATGNEQPPPGQDPLDSSEKGENTQAGSDSGDPNAPAESNSQSDKDQAGMKNSGQSGSAGENSSLSEKMRDALANLLAKLRPNQGDSKQGKPQAQNGSQSSQQKGQSSDSNSSQSQNKQQAEGDASAQSQSDQQGQNGSQQTAQGKSDGKSSDKPNSPDGKSGIGKQDGDKTAREAAELAAMGKISEIIGKRAANVSGEVMVEVASGKQQLKTQYSQKSATHAEAGGEINRDEVPLAYQQYVQQYFEVIRKLPASKGKAKGSGN